MSITVAGTIITMNSGAVVQAPTGTASLYFGRAWVIFNQITSSILGSTNISSVGDLGVGLSSINFSTAMPDANYAVGSTGEGYGGGGAGGALAGPSTYSMTTASFNVACASNTAARGGDWPLVSLIIAR
jgi:hypothetical protein